MLVQDWMNTHVITLDVNDSMKDAARVFEENNLDMAPVVDGGNLIGVLTDGDIKRASASDATVLGAHELHYLLARIKVKDIMSRHPVTLDTLNTVEEAAALFLEKDISGAPVLDGKKRIVGTITQREIFRVLISLTGIGKRGIQFAFVLEDRPGSIKEVGDLIREYGGRMVSILSSYEQAPPGRRNVYIRMHSIDRERLAELMARLDEKVELVYMLDHREGKREFRLGKIKRGA
jgi:acetoin utilization protein AcuB